MTMKSQPVQLQVGQFQQVPRMIAGQTLTTFIVDSQPYVTTGDAAALLGVTVQTLRALLDNVYREESDTARGAVEPPPLQQCQIPVFIQSTSDTGRGGGTQWKTIHSLRAFLKAARRSRNASRQAAVLDEVDSIYLEYQAQGFVVSPYALAHDPNVKVRMEHRLHAHNFSLQRHLLADQNLDILPLIARCHDVLDENGRLSNAKVSYCQVRMHNTAHVSVHGMTSGQLVYARIDSSHPFLGQENFTGQFCPNQIDYRNACNYLTQHETSARTAVLHAALNRIHMYIDQHGAISYREMLQMFVMFCVSPYNPYISWDYRDYPETAISTVINLPNKTALKQHVYEAIQVWKALYPNRKTLDHFQMGQLMQAEKVLTDVCLSGEGMGAPKGV